MIYDTPGHRRLRRLKPEAEENQDTDAPGHTPGRAGRTTWEEIEESFRPAALPARWPRLEAPEFPLRARPTACRSGTPQGRSGFAARVRGESKPAGRHPTLASALNSPATFLEGLKGGAG